jgi:hypothetical protein
MTVHVKSNRLGALNNRKALLQRGFDGGRRRDGGFLSGRTKRRDGAREGVSANGGGAGEGLLRAPGWDVRGGES